MNLNGLQKRLAKWQKENFSPESSTIIHMALGMSEETGELCHAVLKAEQKIRKGLDVDDSRKMIADAVVDNFIFGMQILSILGYEVEEVLESVAQEVLNRNWKNNPGGTGFSQHKEC